MLPSDTLDGRQWPRNPGSRWLREQIRTLDRRKRAIAANREIWRIAIIEPDWYKPRVSKIGSLPRQ
jgi:hypothetical protein